MVNAKPTLRAVAKRAGVSLGTASNVLNNRSNVAESTRARVLEAATALGYRAQVRSVARKLTVIGTIGKNNGDQLMSVNPFYSYVLAGIERECGRHNLSMMYANIEVNHLNRPTSLPTMLLDSQVDGFLLVGTFLPDTIRFVGRQIDKPVVLLDAYAPGGGFDSVLTDNLNGAYSAVAYLIQQGHRRIGLVGSLPDAYPSIQERRKGYLRALKHHQISQSYVESSPLTQEGGYAATRALLSRAPEVTAIFACNDEVAFGVIEAATDMGRVVPDDLSVMGFDDVDMARQVTPALSTVCVEKMLMGILGVRYLIERAENPERPVLTTLISTQLVLRASVRALENDPARA